MFHGDVIGVIVTVIGTKENFLYIAPKIGTFLDTFMLPIGVISLHVASPLHFLCIWCVISETLFVSISHAYEDLREWVDQCSEGAL